MADIPDELTVTLRKPVTVGDITISELKLREPTVGELEKATAKGTDLHQAKMLVSIVAGMAPEFIDRIGARDFKLAADYLANFS